MERKYKNIGIYKITCVPTKKIYIGSSIHLDYRKRNHFNLLKRNIHKNIYLQASFNKYGINNFLWDILEYVYINVNNKHLIEKEEFWIGLYNANNRTKGFNLRNVCENNSYVSGRGLIVKGENNHRAILYSLIDITNNKHYSGRCVAEFCRQQGISDASGYFALLQGRLNIWLKKFVLKEKVSCLKRYTFKNKNTGKVISSYFLKEMCLENNLLSRAMTKVFCGRHKQYKGWAKHEIYNVGGIDELK